jgi:hypothetical protein
MTMKRKAKAAEAPDRPLPSLPQLCTKAADHVARARIALHDESLDADQALIHLDEAIACLKRLWTHGRARQAASGPSLRSA